MFRLRAAEKCGSADYGWLKSRYSFSFGHYFDPQLLGFGYLQVLNQEVLAAGATFQPRSFPRVDVLNIILQGEAGYRSSDGQMTHARAGDALLFAGDNTIYQESNASPDTDLVRLQLWLQTCPEQNSPQLQHLQLPENEKCLLIASGDGQQDSLKLRQNIRVFQLSLQHEETHIFPLQGSRCYLQSVYGGVELEGESTSLQAGCGDGILISDEKQLHINAKTDCRLLIIDCCGSEQAA